MSTLTLRLEGYSRAARQALGDAQTLADGRRHAEVEPLHLFTVLVERDDAMQQALEAAGLDPVDALVECEHALRSIRGDRGGSAYLSPRTLDLLGRAEAEGARTGAAVSTAHLAVACAQDGDPGARAVLRACGLSAPALRAALAQGVEAGGRPAGEAPPNDASDPLDAFGSEMTRLAAQGRFDPTVGRDAELRRIVQVLARHRGRNPLLVGEPGIGKRAIVRALASRIATGDVPRMLAGKRLLSIDVGALGAGTKLRGELDERMRRLLASVRDAAGGTLLFVPELAALLGPRAGAGELLASALDRDEAQAIAVTTPDGLRKLQDSADRLLDRFVLIPVDPPTSEDAVAVLRGLVARFEAEHGVRIADPSLVEAVKLARRYVPDAQLPKSAVDLVDEAAARVRVRIESVPSELDALSRRLEALDVERRSLADEDDAGSVEARARLEAEAKALVPRIEALREQWDRALASREEAKRLREEIAAASDAIELARAGGDTSRADELASATLPDLEAKLRATEARRATEHALARDVVVPEDVADVVAAWTGIPVSRMLEAEADKLLHMEERLARRIVGQDHAVGAVSKAVRRGRVGLRDPKRPIGSFLFLGPTGVGKTELAKALAEFLFDDEGSLTRLDMSEFMEKHMVARLLGAPPGYVDSEEGGFLTEAVRRKPYSLVLFDEIEKAHPDVFDVLLQVLDDGRLTDSKGRVAHFQDTVLVLTSNVGSELVLDDGEDAEAVRATIDRALRAHFRPEFLNRIDDVIVFRPLDRTALAGICDIQLRRLGELLALRGMKLAVTPEARDRLVELGYDPAFGARPLRRAIVRELQDPLAEAMLRGNLAAGATVIVRVDGERFVFE